MQIFLELASKLKGAELQCPVSLPSRMLIEGGRACCKELFEDHAIP